MIDIDSANSVRHVFKIRLSISGQCNYNCFFCHNEGRRHFSNKLMSLDNIMLLCKAAYLSGIRSFTFTGGEPLTHPMALSIIERIRLEFPDVTIKLTTNASLLTVDDVPFLEKNIDKIRINFQSVNRNIFKRLVGVDCLPQLMDLIAALRWTNVHICLNYVYNKESKSELPEILNYATENKLEMKVLELIKNEYNFSYYEPISNAKQYLESVTKLSKKDYQNDDLYFMAQNSPKIRLCYSHCNTLDGKSCSLLGELRTSPVLEIYPCMSSMTQKCNVKDTDSPEEVAKKILYIDSIKGICPT